MARLIAFVAGAVVVYIAGYAARQLLVHAERSHYAEFASA